MGVADRVLQLATVSAPSGLTLARQIGAWGLIGDIPVLRATPAARPAYTTCPAPPSTLPEEWATTTACGRSVAN